MWGGRGLEESSVQWHEAVKAAYTIISDNHFDIPVI